MEIIMPNFPETKVMFTETHKTKKKKKKGIRGIDALLKAKAAGKIKTPITMNPERIEVIKKIGVK